jgi:zinc transport system permease protein
MLLAVVVNTCLNIAGALLINALLILPSASAGNLSRNMRQFFWLSVVLSLVVGLGGYLTSVYWVPEVGSRRIHLVSGGMIVLVGVGCFFLSMALSRWARGNRPSLRTGY